MPNALRFLFTGNSVLKVIANTIQVEDVQPGGPASDPPPGSMRVTFRQSDPGPAQICPLLPGTMQFLVDAAAPGSIPNPDMDPFTEQAAGDWKTRGRIVITAADATTNELAGFAPLLLVKPTRVWYGPVTLSPAFLFETLTGKTGGAGLKKAPIPTAAGTIRTTDQNWFKHAIANFLTGRYLPLLESAAAAAQDDRVRFVMPTVDVAPDGTVVLNVTTALAQKPQDALDSQFDIPAPPVGREQPTHPRNGLIPAREVYRQLRPHMVAEAAAAAPVMDAVLADWPFAPRFFPIQFTRTWEAVPNCSVHFPRQTLNLRTGPANIVTQQPLPAHGVVFVRQEPPPIGQPVEPPPMVELWLTGGTMKWLIGGGTSWQQPGGTAHVAIDLAAVLVGHVSVRLPMSEAMLADTTKPDGCGFCCTYMSLRRTVRALVDNRIAGGRLNFGVASTSALTRGIIHRAWLGTPASAGIVADNQPPVTTMVGQESDAVKLIPVLEAFFPGDAQQFPFAGMPANPVILTRGRMLHDLWQSRLDEMSAPSHRANFSDAVAGRGGPGAAVSMGIATFHVNPARQGAESNDQYHVRVTNEMLVGLVPGAVLQYWLSGDTFEEMKARQPAVGASGHSPVFFGYRGPANARTGINIIDQNGVDQNGNVATREVDTPPALPLLGGEEIWIAANWTE